MNRRHFGLCGVIIPGADYPSLNIEGRKLQEKCLGKGKFKPFHYVEILNNSRNYAFLGKDQSIRQSLTMKLNSLISGSRIKVVASFIDKNQLILDYGIFSDGVLRKVRKIKPNLSKEVTIKDVNLYDISLKFILNSYYIYLKSKHKRGLIIAEARGEKEDSDLLTSFYNYQRTGAGSLSGKELRSYITDLLIIRKTQNHIGTQLADLITYPFYDYFVPNHNVRTDHFILKSSFEKKILNWAVFPKQKRS